MPEFNPLEHLRMPIGSILVDVSLVFALIWNVATINEAMHSLASRMDRLEQSSNTTSADGRLRVVEAQNAIHDRELADVKSEIMKRLDSQDAKIDAIYRAVVTRR